MVVGNFDGSSFAIGKHKTYPPLIINPDAPLACSITGKGFKAV